MRPGGKQPRERERGARAVLALLVSLAALGYASWVVIVAWNAPDKGFLAFTGRKVVDVSDDSDVARAGVKAGDTVAVIDGEPVLSTADYIARLLSRRPGDVVDIAFARPGQEALIRARVTLEPSPAPLPAIAALLLAAVLALLGLVARHGRPGDPAARRFWRTSVVYSIVYCGALSWSHLLVHPVLAGVFFVALFLAAPMSLDFSLIFPVPPKKSVARWRALAWTPAALLLIGLATSAVLAIRDHDAGLASDRALEAMVGFISAFLVYVTILAGGGLFAQYRRARSATGAQRAQLRWLLFGLSLAALPTFVAIPVALADMERFLLYRYRPFVVAVAILWFTAHSLAVLRIRLADVDAVIHRSAVYAAASGGAILVYLGVVLAVGAVAERAVGGGSLVPQIVAAATAAAMFGPLRTRVTQWLDRRFFRDRLHYVHALRELAEVSTRLQEPPELAEQVVDRAVQALRASSGALYLQPADGGPLQRIHGSGDEFPQTAAPTDELFDDGVTLPIERNGEPIGLLVFGPRLDGELYASQDRDLLAAVAGQLAVAFENARAFGTIAAMTRTLEAQNAEIRELRDRLEDENRYLKGRLDAAAESASIVGSSKAVRALVKQVDSVAATAASVLLLGESGTGKGLVARTIHAASERKDGPFIHVDCGAIPHGVFESELFGHERGAFTGAVRRRRGHFELADGGTLFLDEVGEIPLELQSKLLRVLQESQFERVGEERTRGVNVRIVAATNRDLKGEVAAGRFRQDLYYRLNVFPVEVVPLRARKEDIPLLAAHFLGVAAKKLNVPPPQLTQANVLRLQGYDWPGNIRELQNVIERAVIVAQSGGLRFDLPQDDPPQKAVTQSRSVDPAGGEVEVVPENEMRQRERDNVLNALRRARWKIYGAGGAAQLLGVNPTTLSSRIKKLGLKRTN